MKIRYELLKQVSNGWTLLAFDENRNLVQQQVNVADAPTALDLVKAHASNNVPNISHVTMVVEGT